MEQKNRHDEDLLCFAFAKHCRAYFPLRVGALWWTHIANQGRSAGQGAKLKKMGLNAGMFDFLFCAWPSSFSMICLEAKVRGRDYSFSQEHFDALTIGMPVYKGKFYSVMEGHGLLVEAGLKPLSPVSLFHEPCYLSRQEKNQLALDMFRP